MSRDIHQHWTVKGEDASSEVSDSPSLQDQVIQTMEDDRVVQREEKTEKKGKSIPVSRGRSSTLFSNALFGMAGVAMLLFVFIQGVSFIQADLTSEFEAEGGRATVNIASDTTDPPDTVADEIPLPSIGSPAPTTTVRDPVPHPTMTGPSNPPSVRQPVANAPAVTPTPTPVPTPTPAPAPVPAPKPVVQKTPLLDVSRMLTSAPSVSAFPLKVNRFTVGSGLVPEFSPTAQIPVHIIRKVQQRVHATVAREATWHAAAPTVGHTLATRQPQTGPGLWIAGFITLLFLPLALRKKRGA